MPPTAIKSETDAAPTKPVSTKPPDIASASVTDTLAALHVNPDTGLTHAEVDASRKEHGYNEVAVKKEHPVLLQGRSLALRHCRRIDRRGGSRVTDSGRAAS
jgi:magnesium-transporting ATPase (P-type)